MAWLVGVGTMLVVMGLLIPLVGWLGRTLIDDPFVARDRRVTERLEDQFRSGLDDPP